VVILTTQREIILQIKNSLCFLPNTASKLPLLLFILLASTDLTIEPQKYKMNGSLFSRDKIHCPNAILERYINDTSINADGSVMTTFVLNNHLLPITFYDNFIYQSKVLYKLLYYYYQKKLSIHEDNKQ